MPDLGMELDAEPSQRAVLHGCHGQGSGGGADRIPGGYLHDPVSVAHPGLEPFRGGSGEERGIRNRHQPRRSELPPVATLDPAAFRERDQLHPVADTQNRQAGLEDSGIGHGGSLVVDAAGASAQDDRSGTHAHDGRGPGIAGEKLAVHPQLAHGPCDQLAVLGAEIEDSHSAAHDQPPQGRGMPSEGGCTG